jgi:hypothetical protein
MFSLGKNREACNRLRESLEISAEMADLPVPQRTHLADCADCRTVADALFNSRALLRKMPPHWVEPGPWFAPRVMAAIAARESDSLRSQEAWAVVPKLAARLSWISALALLLAGTWLYKSPDPTQKQGNESTIESLFDAPAASAPQDDVLISLERGR